MLHHTNGYMSGYTVQQQQQLKLIKTQLKLGNYCKCLRKIKEYLHKHEARGRIEWMAKMSEK